MPVKTVTCRALSKGFPNRASQVRSRRGRQKHEGLQILTRFERLTIVSLLSFTLKLLSNPRRTVWTLFRHIQRQEIAFSVSDGMKCA